MKRKAEGLDIATHHSQIANDGDYRQLTPQQIEMPCVCAASGFPVSFSMASGAWCSQQVILPLPPCICLALNNQQNI